MKALIYSKISKHKTNVVNMAWSVAEIGVYPLILIGTTPIFIAKLGTSEYGVWLLLQTSVALMGLVNPGFGEGVIKLLSQFKGVNQASRLGVVINSTLLLYLCLSIAFACLAMFFPFEKMGFLANRFSVGFVDALPWAVLLFAVRLPEFVIVASFKGVQRYDKGSRWMMISKSGSLLSACIAIYLTGSLSAAFQSMVVFTSLLLVFEFIELVRLYGWSPFFKRPSFEMIKWLFNYSRWTWIQTAAATITSQADKVLVASLLGTTIFAYYAIGAMILNQFHALFNAAVAWVFPIVSERSARKQDLTQLFAFMRLVVSGIVFAAQFGILLLADFIFPAWLGADFYAESKPFIYAFLIYGAVLSGTITPYFFLNGMGNVKMNTGFELVLKSLNFIALLYGFYLAGSEGIIFGMATTTFLFMVTQELMVRKRVFNRSFAMQEFEFLIPLLLVVFAVFAGNYLLTITAFLFGVTFLALKLRPKLHSL